MTRILVVQRDPAVAKQMATNLRGAGYETELCGGPDQEPCPVIADMPARSSIARMSSSTTPGSPVTPVLDTSSSPRFARSTSTSRSCSRQSIRRLAGRNATAHIEWSRWAADRATQS
jgi:hypothetical protein